MRWCLSLCARWIAMFGIRWWIDFISRKGFLLLNDWNGRKLGGLVGCVCVCECVCVFFLFVFNSHLLLATASSFLSFSLFEPSRSSRSSFVIHSWRVTVNELADRTRTSVIFFFFFSSWFSFFIYLWFLNIFLSSSCTDQLTTAASGVQDDQRSRHLYWYVEI